MYRSGWCVVRNFQCSLVSWGEPFDTRVLFASVAKQYGLHWMVLFCRQRKLCARQGQTELLKHYVWLAVAQSLMPIISSVGTSTHSKSGTESRTYLPEVGNECRLVAEVSSVIGFLECSFFHKQILAPFVVPLTDLSNPYIVDTNLREAAGLLQNECSWILCLITTLLQHEKLWGKWLCSLLLYTEITWYYMYTG